jgi:hypothetical protein
MEEIKKVFVPDANQGHWLIYRNGNFICSCDDAELQTEINSLAYTK